MKTLTPILAFAALTQTSAMAQSENRTELAVQTGCQQQYLPDCSGTRQQLNWTRRGATSYWRAGYEKFSESADHTYYSARWPLADVAALSAQGDWNAHTSGKVLRLAYGFRLGTNSGLEVGAYLGRMNGGMRLHEQLDLDTKASTLAIPGTDLTLSIPTLHQTLMEHSISGHGMTNYGGLTQAAEIGFNLQPRLRLSLHQMARAGVDRISYGVGVGLSYSSHTESDPLVRPVSSCGQPVLAPATGYRLSASLCSEKVVRDPLDHHIIRKTNTLADRLTGKLAPYQDELAQLNELTGQNLALPTFTGPQLRNWMDLDQSVGARPLTRFTLQASRGLGPVGVTFWRSQMVGGVLTKPSYGASISYRY